MDAETIEGLIGLVRENQHPIGLFCDQVRDFFLTHPTLNSGELPAIHSVKSRIKNLDHLRDKLQRKAAAGRVFSQENLFKEITDLAGVRVLHLHQRQFVDIHSAINKRRDDVLGVDTSRSHFCNKIKIPWL